MGLKCLVICNGDDLLVTHEQGSVLLMEITYGSQFSDDSDVIRV